MCSIITIQSNLQGRDQCQDIVSLIYHGISPQDDVTIPVNTESVFISPHGRVTINLFTCFILDVDKTTDLGVAIKYEPSGTISIYQSTCVCNRKFQPSRLYMII